MKHDLVQRQRQAAAEVTRARLGFACSMAKGTWSPATVHPIAIDHEPAGPRRHPVDST
ncbi:MAG: hypothetical protein M5U14_09200 [Acidimicrobiia bacterium]|nr:hypothetical protein [Acidimicrobiia bacterium]